MRLILLVLPLLLITACHGDSIPGATTSGEDQALNDAAAMLDANSVDANAIDLNTVSESQPE